MKKLAIVFALLFVGLFLTACGSGDNQVANTGDNGPVVTSSVKATPSADSAIGTFNKVKEAYNKNDLNLFKQQLTKASVDALNAIAPTQGEYLNVEEVTITLSKDAEFIKETKEGDKSIITAKVTSRDGKVSNLDHIFVKENGVWKFDWVASLERAGK